MENEKKVRRRLWLKKVAKSKAFWVLVLLGAAILALGFWLLSIWITKGAGAVGIFLTSKLAILYYVLIVVIAVFGASMWVMSKLTGGIRHG